MDGTRRNQLYRALTKAIHGSSPFITIFALVHLSAPLLANLGGSSLASQTMLLGREYYQTSFGEAALVITPITVHVLSALLKRLLASTSSDPKNAPTPRPITSPLSVTGYATALLFLPIHYLSHRSDPTSEAPPIFGVGPAELDFEFVKLGLQRWPVRSWILYGGLVLFTSIHVADGIGLLWATYFKPSSDSGKQVRNRKLRRRLALGGVVLPTLTGIYFIAQEPLMTFSSTAGRYTASFMRSFVYRI
ncbi:hypothetical protein FA15DRAFT_668115 [Coprinopsis marcescibilis]|uniref:Mitochondrial adapter protein MCP1 transmembrane domain-containing protein n=1 Tax=Coprinopsis marcescibilis TaxID=230819 RepID=A0A5C3KYQ1_COPMA|nr:hypothetical protein FA15DRAFT_668115 [Coprinopsis marcescibilis]